MLLHPLISPHVPSCGMYNRPAMSPYKDAGEVLYIFVFPPLVTCNSKAQGIVSRSTMLQTNELCQGKRM